MKRLLQEIHKRRMMQRARKRNVNLQIVPFLPTLDDFESNLQKNGHEDLANLILKAKINHVEPIYNVYGTGKKEFVEKLSSIMDISVVKREADYIQITYKANFVMLSRDEQIETANQMVDLLNSINTVKIIPVKEADENTYNKKNDYMDKEQIKKMICQAIDNIPDCAEIKDCYTEHGFMAAEAYIKIFVKVTEETDANIIEFHNIAHDAFGTEMGQFS